MIPRFCSSKIQTSICKKNQTMKVRTKKVRCQSIHINNKKIVATRIRFRFVINVLAVLLLSCASHLAVADEIAVGNGQPLQMKDSSQNTNYPSDARSLASHFFIGKVVNVESGDKLDILLPDGKRVPVRLAGLRAPDKNSIYATVSREWLRSQLQGQLVSAECDPASAESEMECVVFPDDRQINAVSLFHGFSTCSGRGSVLHDAMYYKRFEDMAKANKSGLWQTR